MCWRHAKCHRSLPLPSGRLASWMSIRSLWWKTDFECMFCLYFCCRNVDQFSWGNISHCVQTLVRGLNQQLLILFIFSRKPSSCYRNRSECDRNYRWNEWRWLLVDKFRLIMDNAWFRAILMQFFLFLHRKQLFFCCCAGSISLLCSEMHILSILMTRFRMFYLH